MVQTGSIVLGLTAILSALFRAFLKPRIDETGVFRTVENFQNDECEKIEGLEACEDIYVHQPSGLAYLTCSRVIDRVHWTPAMSKLNRDRIPVPSLDYITILDLKTHAHKKLSLTNLPGHILKHGLHTHGLDLYVESYTKESEDQSSVTLYMVNHNPPDVLHQASSLGAQSVIEVFKTKLGSSEAEYQTTVSHPLILTPNNLVAMSSNSFYVTNDHAKKFGWSNSIVHCSLNGSTSPDCIVAGPEQTIYMGTSFDSHLRLFDAQGDHTLVLTDERKMPRSIDNIYVTEKGSVYLAMVPKAYDLSRTLDKPGSRVSPTEVWRVSNATEQDKFFGGRLKVEKVFADDGHMVSMTTCVAVYEDKLYLTGQSFLHYQQFLTQSQGCFEAC
ncbi:hypothetical protein DFH28DRAFT_901125 [Melampsora americana]|nr:hypothetical protein DFH28DRAFT_901125 [Melampsora americana]